MDSDSGIDLKDMGWPPTVITRDGIEISATCTIDELTKTSIPPDWPAAALLFEACAAALAPAGSARAPATVGDDICQASPAASMISLTAALDGVCTILTPDGGGRRVAVVDFVTGAGVTALLPGELLRSVFLPASALRSRAAIRRAPQTPGGTSSALLIGRLDPTTGRLVLTITASTPSPVVLTFPDLPDEDAIRDAVADRLPPASYVDDGDASSRETLTVTFAEQIRRELSDPPV